MLKRRLEDLRESKDWTKTKVAQKLNIPLATYASYESGKHSPDLEMLCKIADLYNVNIDFLVGYKMKSNYSLPENITNYKEATQFLENIFVIAESKSEEDIIKIAQGIFYLTKK